MARSKEWSSFLNDDHKINNNTTETTFAVSTVALSEGIVIHHVIIIRLCLYWYNLGVWEQSSSESELIRVERVDAINPRRNPPISTFGFPSTPLN